MHYFSTNFQKSLSSGAQRHQRPLSFDFCDLKLRNMAKLQFLKLIVTKSNLSIMTSFQ